MGLEDPRPLPSLGLGKSPQGQARSLDGAGFTRENKLRIDLHIGGSILNNYPQLYHELCKKESLINEALGLPLIFTAPGSGGAAAGRIEVDRPATIEEAQESNVILDWTVLNVISFRSAFTSHIKELLS